MDTNEKKGQGFSSRMGLLLTLIGAAIGDRKILEISTRFNA